MEFKCYPCMMIACSCVRTQAPDNRDEVIEKTKFDVDDPDIIFHELRENWRGHKPGSLIVSRLDKHDHFLCVEK